MLNTTVGGYRIDGLLGEGGMGAVYAGTHLSLGRRAAIKVLHPHMARDQGIVSRFFNEARAVNIIGHPSIVSIYDYGQLPDGTAYLVMEFLTGLTLSRRLEHAPLADTIRFSRQIANALSAAHDNGIVHRDLKPDNVMVVRDPEAAGGERVKLLDFGIAKLTDSVGNATQTGAVMGTPHYMSPEQCRGAGHVDAKSDVYSLGVMLFQLSTGNLPFDSEGAGSILAMHIYEAPKDPSSLRPGIPTLLSSLILTMMAKDPTARPSMRDVESALTGLGTSVGFAATSASSSSPVQSATTLGLAAGAKSIVPAKTKRSLAPIVAVVGLLAGGIAVAVVVRRSGDANVTTSPQPEEPAPKAVAAAAELPAAATPVVATPQPQPLPPVAKWTFESVPSGADVIRRDTHEKLCVTPCTTVVGDGISEFDILLEGHKPSTVKVDGARVGSSKVMLEAVTNTTSTSRRKTNAKLPPPPTAKALTASPPSPPPKEPAEPVKKKVGDGVADPFRN